MNLSNQFEIPKVGIDGARWARGIFTCPHCGKTLEEPHHLYFYVIGVCETTYGDMKVPECPFCFEKYYSHASDSDLFHIRALAENNEHLKHLL